MKHSTSVFCTLQFEGFHCWPNAPEVVAYLTQRHRHIFHVKAEKQVGHTDRDIEFITLKQQVANFVKEVQASRDVANWSCEMWATIILDELEMVQVEVSEDGENGAIVRRVA